MKLVHQNLRKGEVKLNVENQDDLWYLSTLIDKKDLVKSKTIRKIKLGEESDRNANIIKKPVTLVIDVEKTELTQGSLRISGLITEGQEDIPKGSYHTLVIEPTDELLIIKERWLNFQLDKVKEACSEKSANLIIVVMDREEAIISITKRSGYTILTTLKGEVRKKEEKASHKEGFYDDVIKEVSVYVERYSAEHAIIASPAFFKEDLFKQVKEESLKKKIVLATCSSVGENAINEVMKRPEVKQVLAEERTTKELKIVEELLGEISKFGKAAYGFKETKESAESGAIATLLITDKLISTKREDGTFEELDSVMRTVDSSKGDIHIINSSNEAGKKLDGLGGIAAILRYKTDYSSQS